MKGFVPTPSHLVDLMVEKLFRDRPPRPGDRLLDPGCGTGAFIQGVERWCASHGTELPQIVGIDSDPKLLSMARRNLRGLARITLLNQDFLGHHSDQFDFIIGNPPYVPITGLSVEERSRYRRQYRTATGRFDLYLLFFEQALLHLAPKGRLVFITPEKFLYTQSAEPLRRLLAEQAIEEVHLVSEAAFGELITYPMITTVVRGTPTQRTRVLLRDGTSRIANFSEHNTWLPGLNGIESGATTHVLDDAFSRISCGVATGADDVFVVRRAGLPTSLRRFAHPTVSGRLLVQGQPIPSTHVMLVPYDKDGSLFSERELGDLGPYLRQPQRRAKLLQRTCVRRKPWYAFHENPPMIELLRPKILCKDIGARPWFVVDAHGDIVPRHSVYYLVPALPAHIQDLCDYLNSAAATEWLSVHCQRAANGFLRLQSHVLRRLPIPEELATAPQLALA